VNAVSKIEQSSTTDIVVIVSENPAIVLTEREKFNEFYAKMKAETDTLAPDTSTEKGRVAIRKMATRVRDTKAAIEKARLGLTKDMRDQIDVINAAGKEIKEELQSLEDEVRKPLTEWEEAEKQRARDCEDAIDWFKHQKVIAEDDTAAAVMERAHAVYEKAIDPELFQDLLEDAEAAKDDAMETLKRAHDRLTKEEADRAELARLRAAEEARKEEEARVAAAQEAARREAEELAAYNERRAAAEKAELERIQRAKDEAAEQARQEEARRAQAEIDAANERARKAEEDAAAERKRIADAKAAEEAEAARVAAENAKREANKAHRTRVKAAAKKSIMALGADDDLATKIVLAIVAGEIPNVSMAF
jgi:colicin import membrane protein